MKLLDEACGHAFPGAVALGAHDGRVIVHHAAGARALEPHNEPNSLDTIYDLASLTKPIAIGTLLMRAVARRQVDLDDAVGPVLAADREAWKAVRVRHLAGHTSGLPAWIDVSRDGGEPAGDLRQRVLAEPFVTTPGQRAVYSDLGYIALGWFLEERLGAPLPVLFDAIRGDFGLEETTYHPLQRLPLERIAPTERTPERGVVRGEVHDPNCWRLGGAAGHAGLFGTARDVYRWAQTLLDAWLNPRAPAPVPGEVVRRFWHTPSIAREPTTWRLCFDTVSPGGRSLAGRHFGPRAVGHLGFTGTSVWLEPDRRWVAVLLSNRVHPSVVDPPLLKALRPRFHDALAELLDGSGREPQDE